MNSAEKLVVFSIEQNRYALRLSAVERIVRALEITSLPKGPPIVLGVINFRGSIVPVVNVRRRFHLPEREVSSTDCFIIGRTANRRVVLVVDAIAGVIDCPAIIAAENVLPGTDYIEGVVRLPDGLVLIQDLAKFLSLDEESAIDEAILAP